MLVVPNTAAAMKGVKRSGNGIGWLVDIVPLEFLGEDVFVLVGRNHDRPDGMEFPDRRAIGKKTMQLCEQPFAVDAVLRVEPRRPPREHHALNGLFQCLGQRWTGRLQPLPPLDRKSTRLNS